VRVEIRCKCGGSIVVEGDSTSDDSTTVMKESMERWAKLHKACTTMNSSSNNSSSEDETQQHKGKPHFRDPYGDGYIPYT